MKALRLALLASALAAGCAISPPDNTYAFKPGTGVVENVRKARVEIPGGTAPQTALRRMAAPKWIDGYQLSLRMDDGTAQAITQDSGDFHAGDRVQVTPQGRVLKLPAATAAAVPAVRAGGAVVQAVSAASIVSAAAGGTATSTPAEQVTLRMDDGTTQLLTVSAGTFSVGQRVTVTPDGRVLGRP
jgi:outer membrane lipoprotein SlyB